jgi:flagella basal body P-ring formation protein FlgA
MRPIAILLALAALAAAATLAAPAAGQPAEAGAPPRPVLKASATVDSDLVRIGDLVENAGAVADVPIFRAPDLGDTGSVPASRVLDAIRSHNLIGIGTNGITAISVTRAARAITRADIEALIVAAAGRERGIEDTKDLRVQFDREVDTVYVEPSVQRGLRVVRHYFDRHGHFDVTLDAPESEALRPLRLSGTVFESREVPIIVRAVAMGELVKPTDVVLERRPKAALPADVAANPDQVVGMTARRALRAGETVRTGDLARPALVLRDHVVTLVYQMPGILLSIRAKALDNGAEGDVINVLNTQSNRTLQATVIGLGKVAITPPASVETRAAAAMPGRAALNATEPQSSSTE